MFHCSGVWGVRGCSCCEVSAKSWSMSLFLQSCLLSTSALRRHHREGPPDVCRSAKEPWAGKHYHSRYWNFQVFAQAICMLCSDQSNNSMWTPSPGASRQFLWSKASQRKVTTCWPLPFGKLEEARDAWVAERRSVCLRLDLNNLWLSIVSKGERPFFVPICLSATCLIYLFFAMGPKSVCKEHPSLCS